MNRTSPSLWRTRLAERLHAAAVRLDPDLTKDPRINHGPGQRWGAQRLLRGDSHPLAIARVVTRLRRQFGDDARVDVVVVASTPQPPASSGGTVIQ
ncbi:hypothetical protein G7075_04360 [Phycicoccus sp. HDW14]|uniref:hypothetical protein n=1 Tax=Phycicoccus sp. HDW14 TaxID=2714941 RepID=UPI0014073BCC|nr:hypothetical protein [Phycicoccus sp. HDW14]QIM20551.1 hypothetical protein G7075_04360 [Phycicoccus sp. HDW14]